MDSLENELLESLKAEQSGEFNTQHELDDFVTELQGPFNSVTGKGEYWKDRVPEIIRLKWCDLPLSTRFMIWSMASEIASLESMVDDFSDIN